MLKTTLTIALLFCCVLTAGAQGPATAWEHVEAIPADTNIQVVTDHDNVKCRVKSVEADALLCGKNTYPRAEVKKVKLLNRGGSALVAFAGAAVASAVVALLASSHCQTIGCVGLTAVAIAGALVLSPILGFGTNFLGHTVYQRR